MEILPIIKTTHKKDAKWLIDSFQKIYETVTLTKGLSIHPFHVESWEGSFAIPLRTVKNKKKVDWNWYAATFTKEIREVSRCNCIIWLISGADRKRFGLSESISGTYRNDPDPYIEIYICADNTHDFQEKVLHEILHFVERTLGNGANTPTWIKDSYYDSLTHAYAYGHKDLAAGFRSFDFTEWNASQNKLPISMRLLYLTAEVLKFMNLLANRPTYFLARDLFLYKVSQRFGKEDRLYSSGIHPGTDWAVPIGTNVVAPWEIEVYEVFTRNKTMGNACYVRFEYGGVKYWMRFLHLLETPKKGIYEKGAVFARTGNTGRSTGPHLHADQWLVPINPVLLRNAAGVRGVMIDPYKWFLLKVDEKSV